MYNLNKLEYEGWPLFNFYIMQNEKLAINMQHNMSFGLRSNQFFLVFFLEEKDMSISNFQL